MKKMIDIINKEKVLIVTTPILLVLLFILSYIKNFTNDSIKFKKEYENLNTNYYKVNIVDNNPIKYSSYNEIFKIINKKTGIIFLGYPKDNNSRYTIEVLLNVIKNSKLNTKIYYLDIHNDRDIYTIENEKLVYQKEDGRELKGTENYFKLLKLLNNKLPDYVISFDGKDYEVGEKRIYFPSFIFVKKGEIIDVFSATTELDSNELSEMFENYLSKTYSSFKNGAKNNAN